MLKQYDFVFRTPYLDEVQSEPAVKIHGILMHSIPHESAQKMHESKYHPFSVYCVPANDNQSVITRISSLAVDADILISAAVKQDKIKISGLKPADIIKRGEIIEADYRKIAENLEGKKFKLDFITPSVFKTGGTESGFPDISMHFLSVIRKMNEFENQNIDFDEFRKAFYKCKIHDWMFENCRYNISGRFIPGMTGYTIISMPDDLDAAMMLKHIFVYASFSGTGARTGMGMGGFFFSSYR